MDVRSLKGAVMLSLGEALFGVGLICVVVLVLYITRRKPAQEVVIREQTPDERRASRSETTQTNFRNRFRNIFDTVVSQDPFRKYMEVRVPDRDPAAVGVWAMRKGAGGGGNFYWEFVLGISLVVEALSHQRKIVVKVKSYEDIFFPHNDESIRLLSLELGLHLQGRLVFTEADGLLENNITILMERLSDLAMVQSTLLN